MLSVIICTHNPRPDYLQRVLNALKAQTLPKEEWELLLIDNASGEPLANVWDLSWHPQGCHIREETLGLTPARLRGISEAKGEILVFVDDDNVLAADYLEATKSVAVQWPLIGAWSGNVLPEFEIPPSSHLEPYLPFLCLRTVVHDKFGNASADADPPPGGAGMGVRREVALLYRDQVQNDQARLGLDRCGTLLLGGGDIDLAARTFDTGTQETALFSKLSLIHLIPAKRLTDDYMVSLILGSTTCGIIMDALQGKGIPPPPSRMARWASLYRYWRGNRFQRRVQGTREQAGLEARKYLAQRGINF